jgi:hypothetical protein
VAKELRSLERGLAQPAALGQEALRPGDAARQHDHERQRQVRHRLRVLPWGSYHGNAAISRRRHIHVEWAAPRAADQAQTRRGGQHRVGDRRGVYDQHILVRQGVDQLLRMPGILVDAPFGGRRGDQRALLVKHDDAHAGDRGEARQPTLKGVRPHERVAHGQDLQRRHPSLLRPDGG